MLLLLNIYLKYIDTFPIISVICNFRLSFSRGDLGATRSLKNIPIAMSPERERKCHL
jgi:hypothetical protein